MYYGRFLDMDTPTTHPPIPFSPSSHSHILHSPLSPSTLSPHSPHNPLTFSIPQSPIFPITQYNAHIPTITPSLHNCPHSPHTRPCNLSVLLYTILCTLTHSSIFPTYCSTWNILITIPIFIFILYIIILYVPLPSPYSKQVFTIIHYELWITIYNSQPQNINRCR